MLKYIITLFFNCSLLVLATAQNRASSKYTISATASLNINPSIQSFEWSNDGLYHKDNIIFNYLTSTSGTFQIEDEEALKFEDKLTLDIPTSALTIGAGFHIMNKNSLFHEFTLIEISRFKYNEGFERLLFRDKDTYAIPGGFQIKTFSMGFRYELGKMFGDPRWSTTRFGISGGMTIRYNSFVKEPYVSTSYPFIGKASTIQISVVPMLDLKLSERLFANIKIIPLYNVADIGSVSIKNPRLLKKDQVFDANRGTFYMGFSAQFRYALVLPRKRRG